MITTRETDKFNWENFKIRKRFPYKYRHENISSFLLKFLSRTSPCCRYQHISSEFLEAFTEKIIDWFSSKLSSFKNNQR